MDKLLKHKKISAYLKGKLWIIFTHPCPTQGTRLCLHRADSVHNVKSMGQLFVCLSVLISVKRRAEGDSWSWTWTGARPDTDHKPSLCPRPLLKCRVTHAGWILHRLEYSGMITFDTFNTQSILDFSRKFSKHCFLIIFSMSRKMRS